MLVIQITSVLILDQLAYLVMAAAVLHSRDCEIFK